MNMKTGKIGIAIQKTIVGVSDPITSEGAQPWSKYIVDIREYLSKLNCDNVLKDDYVLKFICYGDNVALIYLVGIFPLRSADNIATIITVPNDIDIRNINFKEIITLVEGAIKDPNFTLEQIANEGVFTAEYDTTTDVNYFKKTFNTKGYAYQYYGGDTTYNLQELIKNNLFSNAYTSKEVVFLLDQKEMIQPTEDVKILDPKTIEKEAIIKFPAGISNQIKIQIDGKDFTSDLCTEKGKRHKIIVSKEGYEAKSIDLKIDKQKNDLAEVIRKIEWKRRITIDCIKVFDEDTKDSISSFDLYIKDKKVDWRGELFTDDELKNAIARISHPKYEDLDLYWSKIDQELKRKKHISISLTPKKATQEYKIGDIILKIELPSTFDRSESPIKGYKVVNEHSPQIELKYQSKSNFWNNSKSLFKNLIKLGCIIVAFMLVSGLLFWGGVEWATANKDSWYDVEKVKTMLSYLADKKFDDFERDYNELKGDEYYKLSKTLGKPDELQYNEDETSGRNYERIKELLQDATWKEQDFKDAGFEDLYNAVKSYEYNTIKQINDDLRAQNPPIGLNDPNDTYLTWSKVWRLAKSPNKQATHTHMEFNNGEINLKEWLAEEKTGANQPVAQTPSTPSQSVTPPTTPPTKRASASNSTTVRGPKNTTTNPKNNTRGKNNNGQSTPNPNAGGEIKGL